MNWNQETTVGEFISDINRWLKLRLQLAEDRFGLPTMDRVAAYIRKQLSSAEFGTINNGLYDVFAEIPQNKNRVYNFWLATMLDYETQDGANACVVLKTKASKEESYPLLVIHLAQDAITLEGNERVVIYRSASCKLDGSTKMMDIFSKAIRLQAECGIPVQDLWLTMDYDFKRRHPICPLCGSTVEVIKCEFGGHVSLVCSNDSCSFRRYEKYECVEDFIDEKVFEKERRFFNKVRKVEQDIRGELGKAKSALQQIQNTLDKQSAYVLNTSEIFRMLDSVKAASEKALDSTRTIAKKKR